MWDPARYLAYSGERLRPALDLMARIDLEEPKTVYDLGCGAGNVTGILAERWPEASIGGIDSSAEMLAKARQTDAEVTWVEADLNKWVPHIPVDILYSNATMHWLDEHRELFPRLAGWLKPGGVLAVQMPRNHAEPSHTCMTEAAAAGPWRERLEEVLRSQPVAEPAAYYDMMASLARILDIWETVYMHVLEGENPVVEWTMGTALRPLLNALEGGQRADFLAEYSARIKAAYPRRADGTTLFPFRRLFMVAKR